MRELEAMMDEIKSSVPPNGKMSPQQYQELMAIQESIQHIKE